MVSDLNPKAVAESATTFSRRVCPLLYDNIKKGVDKMLEAELPLVESVHFTTDHWTSCNNYAFQALTLHYVTTDWQYRKWTVNCRNQEGQHTGEAVAAMTDAMIGEIRGLSPDTFKTMTTDAASNMRKAMRESTVVNAHLRCIDHVINTCVQVQL
jgi:hypothetical protein